MQMQNPHDKFFKETFSDAAVTGSFIGNYLPSALAEMADVHTLHLEKDSYIDESLRESFSDLLFSTRIHGKDSYLYFLFEHKSYPTKDIALQLLKYILGIWNRRYYKEKKEKLPAVIPIIVYHGRKEWNEPATLGEMIDGYESFSSQVKAYIPNFETLLFNLTQYTDEEIKGEVKLQITLRTLRDIRTKTGDEIFQSISHTIVHLKRLEDEEGASAYFETLMQYVFLCGKELNEAHVEQLRHIIESKFPERSDSIMTLAELYTNKGVEKGMEKGIEKGIAKALIQTVNKQLTLKFGALPDEMQKQISELDCEILEKIIENIFKFESVDDVKMYLK